MTPEDRLLRRYASDDSQSAFDELVRRHYAFVLAVCKRKLEDPALAEDATQAVFILLARKAPSFRPGTVLSGWLFQTAILACRNARRADLRRRHYEQKAMGEMVDVASSDTDGLWTAIEPHLDDALARLSGPERDAVLLRYGEEMTLQEVGVALGISAAAAHKRIARALDRLRRHLRPASGAITALAFAEVISERMAHADAPAGVSGAFVHAGAASRAASIADSVQDYLRIAQIKIAAAVVLGVLIVAGATFALSRTVRSSGATIMATASQVTLTGRVVDSSGQPVGRAAVTIGGYSLRNMSRSVTLPPVLTDAQGRFSTTIPQGDPMLWIAAADTGDRMGVGQVSVDGTANEPGIVVSPAAAVRIRLVDERGKPLAHVAFQPVSVTRTINVAPAGTSSSPQPIPSGGESEERAGVGLGGGVGEGTKARAGVVRQITYPLQAGCPSRLRQISDDRGIVTFNGLPRGSAVIFSTPDATYIPVSGNNVVEFAGAGDPGDRTVTLVRAGSIAGTLTYSDGAPASGVRIGAQSIGDVHTADAVTDDRGYYQIAGLLPGHYNVAVDETSPALRGDWTAVGHEDQTVSAGAQLTGRDMTLIHGGTITGKAFTADGEPATEIQIGVYGPAHPESTPWVEAVKLGPDGSFRLRTPPGRNYVYVMTTAEADRGKDVTVPDGGSAAVTLKMAE